ncbi:MAG: LysM peptidoglycan-binding domain-containing protein [Ferruginibacter sp.]
MRYFIFIFFHLLPVCLPAQKITPEEYIRQYKDVAITEMKRMGVPAAITLAQGILESENGNSELVKKSNNHFGIKCKNTWTGETVYHDDDAAGECFRSYKTAEESFRDHSNFLRGNGRYAFLFQLDAADYKAWAYGLKKAGYATNPQYPDILIRNIEQYNLQQYTLAAIQELPDYDGSKYISNNPVPPVPPVTDTLIKLPAADPSKITSVNNLRCVLAPRGTSLLAIAQRQKTDLAKLLEYNELTTDGLLPKTQYVFLQKKSKTGEKDFYIVQEGESLYDVAQQNGIQLASLLEYNRLNRNDKPAAGSRLWLQPGKNPATGHPQVHTVAPGEGLYAIARRYNVSVSELRNWNHLQTDELKPGQQLIIGK